MRAASCPHCTAGDVVRFGTYKGTQLYWCKVCKRKYTDNGAMPGRKVPPDQVGAAVSMFYSGMSLAQVQQTFDHMYDFRPSTATIYEWVVDYTNTAIHEMKPHKAKTGDIWVADEMMLTVGGKKMWNWNVMDGESRYILAVRLSPTRMLEDAEAVMREARRNADRPPKFIVTDRLASYIDGIERAFGSESKHIQSDGIRAKVNNNMSERLQGAYRARSKVMRGLKRRDTGQLILDGWTLHYNHFRPHMSLEDNTPGSVAGIEPPIKNWEDVARLPVQRFSVQRIQRERLRDKTFRRRRGGL